MRLPPSRRIGFAGSTFAALLLVVAPAVATLSARDLRPASRDAAPAAGGWLHLDARTRLDAAGARQTGDSADVAGAVQRFHEALAAGDSAAALSLLAPDVTILESGDAESRDEYRAHHLPADISFVRAVRSVRSPTRVVVQGDVAWATGTSTTRGQVRGRALDTVGAELMVLTRSAAGWKIRAIHWSSHNRRP